MANDIFGFFGTAEAYVDILTDTGEETGFSLRGNCSEFTPKPDSETKELTGNGNDNYPLGQTLVSVVIPKPMTATIKFNQFEADLFAAAFFGTTQTLTQDAATAATFTVTAKADKFVDLGKYNVTVTDVENAGVPLALGVDYEVNGNLGMIKLLGTSSLADDGDVLTVTANVGAVKGSIMKAMTKPNILIRVKLDGQNYADGRRFVSEIYRMRLAPSSSFSFIGNDFAEATFEGKLELPSGKDTPMTHAWLG